MTTSNTLRRFQDYRRGRLQEEVIDRKEKAEGREKEGRGCGRGRGRGAEVDGEGTVGRRREGRRME